MVREATSRLRPIVDDSVERVAGRDAQQINFSAGQALSDIIRTTLGPKGLDKMLISSEGKVVVTNNGASVLDKMGIDHPAAETIVQVARKQDERIGDGATTAVVLAGELLAGAEALLEQGVHQTTITNGYRLAANRATELLEGYATEIDPDDIDQLKAIAGTVITGRWDAAAVSFLAGLAVEATLAIEQDNTIDQRRITRRGCPSGGFRDSEIIDGLVIDLEESSTAVLTTDKTRSRRIEGAKVALIDDQLTIETVDGLGTVGLDGADGRRELLAYEDSVYAKQVETIVEAGADVVFCQGSIDDTVQHLLDKEGILAVERTRRDEFIQLARATGATHVGSFDLLTAADTGYAGLIERRRVGTRELAIVSSCRDTEQVSLLLRAGSEHVVDELDRIMDDCLSVLELAIENRTVVPGGGAIEAGLAGELRAYAEGISDREGLAIEAFADALEVVPRTLATTAGLDPVDALIDLRNHHHNGVKAAGIDLTAETGTIRDMTDTGVLEPLAVKERAINGAEEAASMLVRVDDIIAASQDESEADGNDHDHDHSPGGLHSTEGYPWAIGH